MIKFKKVKFKNFGSFGNTFTELYLDKNPTTLICGNNGSGKSFAFLDSITFALFGKPFRKINIPQMANSINKKQCIVEIEFSKANDEYLVRRGLNPKVFEIFKNNQLLNQDAKNIDYQSVLEEQILKMNYKTFTQVVILGSSSFVPFMQLTASDRRLVIENILDISVFSTMNTLLKGKILQIKESIKDLNLKIEIENNKIQTQTSLISSLEKRTKQDSDALDLKILEIEKTINSYKNSILDVQEQLKSITYSDVSKLNSHIKDYNKLKTKIDTNLSNIEKDINFFTNNISCPSCNQSITEDIKYREIDKRNNKKKEYVEALSTISSSIDNFSEKLKETEKVISFVNELNLKLAILNSSKNQAEQALIELIQDSKRVQQSIDIDSEKIKLLSYNNLVLSHEQSKIELKEELEYYEYASDLLKDSGVKSKIIKYYLPFMNKYINKFLTSMDFFAQFTLDEEFNEIIKSRHRDEFSYMNFSEGEKMRIDLALLLAWREIAKIKNSVNCNLLILDEVFDSSLDSVGIDELMKLINAISNKSNIYIISHKSDQLVDKFSTVIGFEKKNNFSKII